MSTAQRRPFVALYLLKGTYSYYGAANMPETHVARMLNDGVDPAAVKPGIWLSNCSSDGTAMQTGWTRPALTAFLANLTASGVSGQSSS